MWKVLSPEVGQFRLACMIQGFFHNASIKLRHAVLSWLLKVWPSTFSYALVFQRMNNSSLAEQKSALWFWPWGFLPTTAQAAVSEAYRFWPPVCSTTWAWASLPEWEPRSWRGTKAFPSLLWATVAHTNTVSVGRCVRARVYTRRLKLPIPGNLETLT